MGALTSEQARENARQNPGRGKFVDKGSDALCVVCSNYFPTGMDVLFDDEVEFVCRDCVGRILDAAGCG